MRSHFGEIEHFACCPHCTQPYTFKVGWTFEGTKHFISQNEKLVPYRAWLLQLFQALDIEAGREAMLAALQKVRASFQVIDKRAR